VVPVLGRILVLGSFRCIPVYLRTKCSREPECSPGNDGYLEYVS
jgi:hypothetical protein